MCGCPTVQYMSEGDWRDVVEDFDMTPNGLVTRSRQVK